MFLASMIVIAFLISWVLFEIVVGLGGLVGDVVLSLLANKDDDDDRY